MTLEPVQACRIRQPFRGAKTPAAGRRAGHKAPFTIPPQDRPDPRGPASVWPGVVARHDLTRGTHTPHRLVVDGGPRAARSAVRADGGWPGLPDGRRPTGRRAHRPADLLLPQPAGALPGANHPADLRGVVPVAARGPAAGARHLDLRRRALPARRQVRPGDQGRASLDPIRADRPAAVGIRQAGLRGRGRLGFLGGRAAPRHAGRLPGDAAPSGHHRAPAAPAGFRPDHADHHGVVRAVLRRRPAPHLGGAARHARARRRVRGLPVLPPRPRALQQVPRPRFGRRLPGFLVAGIVPLGRLVRHRGWPSGTFRTHIPTSSSPSPARSSA
jgi:hypothetical protein